MKYLLAILLSVSTITLKAQEKGIKFFSGTFEEAKKEAAKQHKYLYIDCYTTWCGPCKMMEREAFTDKEAGDYFNAHFVCYKSDMEKGDGITIKNDYNVNAYPTGLFVDASGEKVHYFVGYRSIRYFIEQGKTALNDSLNYKGMLGKFEKGKKDTAFLKRFIAITSQGNQKACEKALTLYWDAIPEADLLKEENYDIFRYYEKDINSKAYLFAYANWPVFTYQFVSKKDYSLYGNDADYMRRTDSDAIYQKAAHAIIEAAELNDPVLFNKGKQIAMLSRYPDAKISAYSNEIKYYAKTGEWSEFLKDADECLNLYGAKNTYLYNIFAWNMAINSDRKEVLEKALVYAKQSLAYGKDFGNVDTYAHVLYKLHKNDEALAAANEAIALAKAGNQTYTETAELVERIQKAKTEKKGK